MKLSFHGAAKMVTGSNHLIETNKSKILLDCGMFQGGRQSERLNSQPFPYDPKRIDAVLVTHAHIDHIGRLPLLVKRGFKGKIYATLATQDLSGIMLKDSESIGSDYARREGREPLYNKEDIAQTMALFQGLDYGQRIEISEDIAFIFRDAGHILGSALVEIWAEGKKIVYSGDLGNSPVPLLNKTEIIEDADYVLVESTYGDRIHEDIGERRNLLEDTIENTVARKGTLLIPSFALERAQELLFELNDLAENHRIPHIAVFIDSPLAINLLEVYQRHEAYFNQEAKQLIRSGDDLFKFPGLSITKTSEQSKQINNVRPPKVIIAGSGMSTGGRILHHEKRYLSQANNTFLIICYQAKGTLGRRLFEGAKSVTIHGQRVPVRCHMKAIGGFSAHADQKGIYDWVEPMKSSVKKVYVVHGEETAALTIAQQLKDHLGLDTVVPKLGQSVKL